ncbi:Crp/Fnr family transcriptional regulator [Croceicoccus ponticola]|nr:Crp/Fnr family transcriptional regulator [Croceicoccus ponticola]
MSKLAKYGSATGNALADIFVLECRPGEFDAQKIVHLKSGEVLYSGISVIEYLYFPIDMIVSLTCDLSIGYSAEFTQIGCDGVVGISALMDGHATRNTAIAQTSGRAYRVSAEVIRQSFDRSANFRRVIMRYMQALMQESAQRIACIRHHSILEQLCRTLLMASDRMQSEHVNLTQEQLAVAIGCRREAVSVAANKIQAAGLIDYGYGKITILNRPGLEARACECYAVLSQAFSEFLPRQSSVQNHTCNHEGQTDEP